MFTAGALAVIRYAKIHGTIRGLQKGIGEQLRATYEELLNEDIPTDHTDLLQRLERNEASSEVTLKR